MKIDYQELLQSFPTIKLSYDNIHHKKVFDSNLVYAIPEGDKYFAWFTTYLDNNICVLMEQLENQRIGHIEVCLTSFNTQLAYGTILSGTLFQYRNTKCFNMEDIYYYKGKDISTNNFNSKLSIMTSIFKNKELIQHALNNRYLVFGLPLIDTKMSQLLNSIEVLPYKVKSLCFKYLYGSNTNTNYVIPYYKPGTKTDTTTNHIKEAIFKVSPDIEQDIYNLYIYNNGKEELYDVAFIPDYKTSVYMNSLFRNIKENKNLDLLEESDDEDEFENMDDSKFVFMDRSFKMKCEFNMKFKKWMPIEIVKNSEKICTKHSLFEHKKYKNNSYPRNF